MRPKTIIKLERRGRRNYPRCSVGVPDFAVIGFDDINEAALWSPALTTVSSVPAEIGAEAARLLLERTANPNNAPRQIILQPRLVIRASCGCHAPTVGS